MSSTLSRGRPQTDLLTKIYIPISSYGYDVPDVTSVITKIRFIQICNEFDIRLAVDETTPGCPVLILRAPEKAPAQRALETIKSALAKKSGRIWQATVLVDCQSLDKSTSTISLEFDPAKVGGRPKAIGLTSESGIDTAAASLQHKRYKDSIVEALAGVVENLRQMPNSLRMRVQFGTLRLKEWTRGKTIYTCDEMDRLAKRVGPRGTTDLDNL